MEEITVNSRLDPAVSLEDNNKALARRFLEAFVNGDLNTLDELLAPDFVNHSLLPGQDPGREAYTQMAAEKRAAYSDIRHAIKYQTTDGDDMVVTCHTTHRIHDRGASVGMEPTGREWNFTHIDMHRIVGGKVVEEWSAKSANPFLEILAQETRQRERVEQELEVARSIQQASLPKEVPTPEDWQINPYYQPARQVGGDFYDFHLLPEGKLGLIVGDATGKGVPAALVMSTTCGMLRLAAQSYTSPGQILQRVNEALCPNIPTNMFVTCFYAIVDPISATLSYANAGHNLPCCSHDDQAATDKLVVGGHFYAVGDQGGDRCGAGRPGDVDQKGDPILNPYGECKTRQGIAAYSFQGALDPDWDPAYSGSYSLVWELHVEGNRLHTGGEFKKVSGVVQNSYARLSPAASP